MKLTSGMESLGLPPLVTGQPSSVVYLHPGQTYVAQSPRRVTTIVGSCVAVFLWNTKLHVGGGTHFLLPQWGGEGQPSSRYGDIALEDLLQQFLRLGSPLSDLHAYVYGGACVLEALRGMSGGLGQKNIEFALQWLKRHSQIHLRDQQTGGRKGRKVILDTLEGTVTIYEIA
jgi:chemotaxis protein CheD